MPEVKPPKVNKGKYGRTFFYAKRDIKPSEVQVVMDFLEDRIGLWDAAVALGYRGENAAARRMLHIVKSRHTQSA